MRSTSMKGKEIKKRAGKRRNGEGRSIGRGEVKGDR